MKFRMCFVFVVSVFLMGSSGAALASDTHDFGTRCQQDFQNDWQSSLPNTYRACSSFNETMMDAGNQRRFYYNLQNTSATQYRLHDVGDHTTHGADTLTGLFVATHGGAFSGRWVYTLHEDGEYAESNKMRLGDDAKELRLLMSYSCDTMKGDSDFVQRWRNVFRGGLSYATGAHGDLYFYGSRRTMRSIGDDLATEMVEGTTMRSAWRIAFKDRSSRWNSNDNSPAVLAVQKNSADCAHWRQNATWTNIDGYIQDRDHNARIYCWTRWTDI